MKLYGDKSIIAFDIGGYWEGSKQNQAIDTWVCGRLLSEQDNVVYLPTFYSKMQSEIERISGSEFYHPDAAALSPEEAFKFFQDLDDPFYKVFCYDVTVCSAYCFYHRAEKGHRILFSYWDPRHEPEDEIGQVISVDADKKLILDVLIETLSNLSSTWF